MENVETWKPIPGLEDRYWVSTLGNVKSAKKVLKPVFDGKYFRFGYQNHETKKLSYMRIHVAMGKAFLNLADGQLVRHLNDVSTDNRLVNLATGSRTDNHLDMVRNGLHSGARKQACKNGHKFTDDNTLYYGPENRWRRCRACKRRK